MTTANIYFQNGDSSQKGIAIANVVVNLIEQKIGRKVGLIIKNLTNQNLVDELEFTSSEATQSKSKFADEANLRKYLPNITAIQLGGLAGGFSAVITGNAVGLDDQQIADNVFSGQRIGDNAARNNATYVDSSGKVLKVDKEDPDKGVYLVNENGGKGQPIAMGNAKYEDIMLSESVKGNDFPTIHTDISINQNALADDITARYNFSDTALGMQNDGPFDVKSQLISKGYTTSHLDGIVIGYRSDGLPIVDSAKSVGNYIAGRSIYSSIPDSTINDYIKILNSTGISNKISGSNISYSSPENNVNIGRNISDSGLSKLATTAGTGLYNWYKNGFESVRYFGENPYSGWAIQNGINCIATSPVQIPQILAPINQPSDLINIYTNKK